MPSRRRAGARRRARSSGRTRPARARGRRGRRRRRSPAPRWVYRCRPCRHRTREDRAGVARLVGVKLNLFITVAALALLVLALGGWVVQAIRRPPALVTHA